MANDDDDEGGGEVVIIIGGRRVAAKDLTPDERAKVRRTLDQADESQQ